MCLSVKEGTIVVLSIDGDAFLFGVTVVIRLGRLPLNLSTLKCSLFPDPLATSSYVPPARLAVVIHHFISSLAAISHSSLS